MIERRATLVAMILSTLLVLPFGTANAADEAPTLAPDVSAAVHHDTSPPLRDMAITYAPPTGLRWEIPIRVGDAAVGRVGPPTGADPLRQTVDRPFEGPVATPSPIINIEGLSDDDNAAVVGGRIVPPDTQGDVGQDYYVQWINLVLAVYRKTDGAQTFGPVAGNSLWVGFGGICETSNIGDPIVLYDHLADRWLLSQFADSGPDGHQCVAISTTSDPTGPYHRYDFVLSPGAFNDYPKIGLWPDGYYVTIRENPPMAVIALQRDQMLLGNAAQQVRFSLTTADGYDALQPGHLEGPTMPPAGAPAIITVSHDNDFDAPPDLGADGYRMWEFDVDWVNTANSTFTELPLVPSSANFSRDLCGWFVHTCVPQQSPGELLASLDELTQYRSQYRVWDGHDSIVINHTVDADGADLAGIRWAEMRRNHSGGGWYLYQDGTYAPADGLHRWMGSLAIDGAGNLALGYSASSSSAMPSIRYTTRSPGDPLGTLPGGEVVMHAGTGVQTSSQNRWGDYSTMSIDPADNCTFWYTQEYYETTGGFDFTTRIGSFVFPSCTTDIFSDGFESGDTSAWD